MPDIQSVAVFCGSRPGGDPVYRRAAEALGDGLARSGKTLIFGGGRIGLMGAVADAALKAGGRVIGVIPDFLTRTEVAHPGVSELIVTDTMHVRKTRMFELADAFVSMPGGLGTFDETFEIITWRQLRLHDKPVLICDVAGSAGPLLALIDAAIAHGFAEPEVRRLYQRVDGVAALLGKLGKMSAGAGGEAALL
ncbi:MAG: TIGR00730 family Rossman fold protein [Alphaproteobacteria bacterium]|nr:TIGR00730 family Rossman fold protein [Alphaproteobacteria bacterium]